MARALNHCLDAFFLQASPVLRGDIIGKGFAIDCHSLMVDRAVVCIFGMDALELTAIS